MTDREHIHRDALDGTLGEVLPDDLDDTAVEQATTDSARGEDRQWFAANHTDTREVRGSIRDDIAASEIENAAASLGLPDASISMANQVFTQFVEQADSALIVEFYAIAALYCACKLNEDAISPSEICDAGPELLSRKMLLRRSKQIASTLGLDANAFMDPAQYIDRYCDELDASAVIRDRAHDIVERCEEAGLSSGKSPTGWAAAAIYLSSLQQMGRITQSELASVAETTEVTIRNRYQEQRDYLQGN